jgi:hypothetical protein
MMCDPENIISDYSKDHNLQLFSLSLLQETVDSTMFNAAIYQECMNGQTNPQQWTVKGDDILLHPVIYTDDMPLTSLWLNYNSWRAEHCGMYYFHGDHLGSATWITDSIGLPVQYFLHDPWGVQLANHSAYCGM